MASLTLDKSGPTPDPLTASSGESISIINNLGADVVFTLSTAGLLNPSQGKQLTVPCAGWQGKVGNTSAGHKICGTYEYTEPGSSLNTRSGRINIG